MLGKRHIRLPEPPSNQALVLVGSDTWISVGCYSAVPYGSANRLALLPLRRPPASPSQVNCDRHRIGISAFAQGHKRPRTVYRRYTTACDRRQTRGIARNHPACRSEHTAKARLKSPVSHQLRILINLPMFSWCYANFNKRPARLSRMSAANDQTLRRAAPTRSHFRSLKNPTVPGKANCRELTDGELGAPTQLVYNSRALRNNLRRF